MMDRLNTAEMQKILIRIMSQGVNSGETLTHYRVTLLRDEPYNLPVGTREVQVLSGGARLMLPAGEYLMTRGEKQALKTGEVASVTAADGDEALVLDMGIRTASPEQQRMKQLFYERMAQRQRLVEVENHSKRMW